jgi:AcrR family transcriptional regulator
MNPPGHLAPGRVALPGDGRQQSARVAVDDTGTRILDAAEGLFAERGFAAVSMRMITGQSGVNLAAANYHFGTKAGLFEAAFARRIVPINRERIRQLDQCLAAATDGRPDLHAIAETYVRPLVECNRGADDGCDPVVVMRLLAKVFLDLREHEQLLGYYEETSERFIAALQRALPGLGQAEVVFRYNSMVAVMVFFALGDSAPLMRRADREAPGTADDAPPVAEAAIAQLVRFIGAGLAARADG